MKDFLIRYYRITKHLILFFKTGYQEHLLEIEHYYLMKSFSK